MRCKRCHKDKQDSKLTVCQKCIGLIVLEWEIRLLGLEEKVELRSSGVLRTPFRANTGSLVGVKFTQGAAA